jgi:hypothetical protein
VHIEAAPTALGQRYIRVDWVSEHDDVHHQAERPKLVFLAVASPTQDGDLWYFALKTLL